MRKLPLPVACYALTSTGAGTAERIAAALPACTVFLPKRLAVETPESREFERLTKELPRQWRQFKGHIVVAATGIVVRTIAPLLQDKTHDPAVVVVDQEGRFAISLLSGHLGRANDLALAVADVLRGQAVITTATDVAGKPSLEVIASDLGLAFDNLKALSTISGRVLENEPVDVYDPDQWLWPALTVWPESFRLLADPPDLKEDRPIVWVGPEVKNYPDTWFLVRPPCLMAGMGCNRGTSEEELAGLVKDSLAEHHLSLKSLGGLASIEAKNDEVGLLSLGLNWNLKINFFRREELGRMITPNPSLTVENHMGVKSVCEAAAMLAARTDRLLITKKKSLNATLAVARATSR